MTQSAQILAALSDGRARTTTEVAAAANLRQENASSLLARMFVAGLVQRSKTGGRNAPAAAKERTWRLAPASKGDSGA